MIRRAPPPSPPPPPPQPGWCERAATQIWALCWRSLTIAWAYALIGTGLVLDLTVLLNMPEVEAALVAYGGPYASHWLKVVGVLTALARMRTLQR